MKFSFKFSQLLGTVYNKGNLVFNPAGDVVIAPVGNRLSMFDLKRSKTETLPIDSYYNYVTVDLAPNGCVLLAINEDGEAHFISLVSKSILHKFRFNRPVNCVKFSPNGQYFAITKENCVFVYRTPGFQAIEFNPLVLVRVFKASYDDTTCLDWSADSTMLLAGSRDMSIRIYSIQSYENFRSYALGGHTDVIVGCFFEKNSLDAYTIARNGHVSVWECSMEPSELKIREDRSAKRESEADEILDEEDQAAEAKKEDTEETATETTETEKFYYKRTARHFLADLVKTERGVAVTAAAYHSGSRLLVTAFANGSFFLHEMPEATLIHSLQIADQEITSVSWNATGEWLALGCAGIGQLLVWEWQSETYVMKQQGQSHLNSLVAVSYSPEGQYLATASQDGKVKVWDTSSGFCFVTFSEHTSGVTSVAFTQSGRALLSASLDGTVRAFDMKRYRNFRTLTSPRPVQFACLAVDFAGEMVAAGGQDVFEVFLWSLSTGRLLEILRGHEGPVSGVAFSPNPESSTMVSVSWDKTLRVWDALSSTTQKETIQLTADALNVCFRPDGKEVGVATLDGNISFFDVNGAAQLRSIAGRHDLGAGRSDTDLITAKKNLEGKAFTSLCYTADGEYVLAGGQSKFVCIYHVEEKVLVKKIEITQNHSLDAMSDVISKRKMTEFGNLALIEDRDNSHGSKKSAIKLPGVRRGDMAARSVKPEVRVSALQFSPAGRAFAAASTEGLLMYSLDETIIFEPFDLAEDVTPKSIRATLFAKDFGKALLMALRLNEAHLIREVYEHIPPESITLVSQGLPTLQAERLLKFLSKEIENSPHLEFHLRWLQALLYNHSAILRQRYSNNAPALRDLQKVVMRKQEDITKVSDFVRYSLKYLMCAAQAHKKSAAEDGEEEEEAESGNESLDSGEEMEL